MEALGIEPKLLIAQVINFLIIAVALNVLLYKPILAMLEKRKKEIAEGLGYTEKMRKEEEHLEGKKAAILTQSRKDGQAIIEEAKKNAKTQEKQILEEARIQAEALVEKGKDTVEKEREEMQKTIRKQSIQLAIAMAKQLLSESMSSDMQHTVLAKHIKQIEKI